MTANTTLKPQTRYSVREPNVELEYQLAHCPRCGEHGGDPELDGETECEYRYYHCPVCNCMWTEVFALASVYIESLEPHDD